MCVETVSKISPTQKTSNTKNKGPSLLDFLTMNGDEPVDLCDIQHIARDILKGLEFLHSMNLTHCDLKLENILFTDQYPNEWGFDTNREFYVSFVHVFFKFFNRIVIFESL